MDGRGRKTHPDGWGFGSPPKRAGRSQESLLVAERGHQWSEGPSGGLGVVGRDGRGWEGLPEGREGSVFLPVGPGRVGSPFRRARSNREALSEGREGTGGPLEGPGGVVMPSRRVGRSQEAHPKCRGVWKPSQKGQEESGVPPGLWEGRKALPESREWLGGPGEVRSPSKRAGRGQEALLESQEGLGGQGKVGSPSQRAESGQDTLQIGMGGVGGPSRRAWMGWEALLESREGLGGPLKRGGKSLQAFPVCRKGSLVPRRAGSGQEALPEGWEGSRGPPRGPG